MLSESLSSLVWIALSGRNGLLAADPGYRDVGRGRVRLRRTIFVTYANSDHGRLTTTYPPARKPLVRTWRVSPVLHVCREPIRHRTPHWVNSRLRQPQS